MSIKNYEGGCIICGAPIVYLDETLRECQICHREFISAAICSEDHYVCDECCKAALPEYMEMLLHSREKAPITLLNEVMELPGMHMHDPEHHVIVPCVLLTCYKNCNPRFDLANGLRIAVERGRHIQGGACGFWGACGAAVGAGIFASIVSESNPLNSESWSKPQRLTGDILTRLADIGGVRCCKRTSYTAIKKAIEWTNTFLGVQMVEVKIQCRFNEQNKECLQNSCPYYCEKIGFLEGQNV